MVAQKRTAKRKTTSRTSARKSPARKASTSSRTATKKSTASQRQISRSTVRTAWTKSEILTNIAENIDLSRKQVAAVFNELSEIICQHIKKGGAGEFTIPGLAKIATKNRPATKARKGINPFTGEETMFKAKPARTVVKVRPLKRLKDMVA